MKRQTSGLCVPLSVLIGFCGLAPHNVHLEIHRPAVTVTAP